MTRPKILQRGCAGTIVFLLLVMLWPQPASAHPSDTSLLYLDVTSTTLGGRVELPYVDFAELFDLPEQDEPEDVLAQLEANLGELQAYLDEHTSIGVDGERWPMVFDGIEVLEEAVTPQGFAVLPFEVELPADAVPRELEVTFDPLFDDIDGRSSIVLVGNDWLGGVFDQEANELILLNPGTRSGDVDLGNPSEWRNFTGSIGAGVEHMRTGPDHIFFILVLLLPSVLVFRNEWEPTPTFMSSLWQVLKIAGVFTLAHSVTFTLAGLDLVALPTGRGVEAIIALSIAVAALHNLRPVFQGREWILAFAFGLFHGLGFASLVQGLEVSQKTQLISLLGRNLGIELSQSLLILLVFPTLFLLRRTRLYRPIFIAGSIALAFVALLWTAERVIDTDFGTSGIIDRLVLWPRSLILLIVGFLVAVGVYYYEKQNDRLIKVA